MRQKGFVPILALLTVLGIAAVAYFSYTKGYININLPQLSLSPSPQIVPTPTPLPKDYFFYDKALKINYYPVQYNKFSNQQQKVAQTFTLDDPLTVKAIVLKAGFGVGNSIYLNIYEAGNVDEFTDGNLVASGMFETDKLVKQNTFEIILNKAVQFEANKEYVMVIFVKDFLTQTSVAFSEYDIFSIGNMYKFTRLSGGNGEILSNRHSWQSEKSQDLLYYFKEL